MRGVIEGAPERFLGDRYHVVRELGRGGMGVVYLGRDLRLDMDVAIKFRGMSHADATLWLKREFRSIASLRHPNLVELYELVAHERTCYFTMEYLPGIDPRRYVLQPKQKPQVRPPDHSTRTVPPLQHANTELSDGAGTGTIASAPTVPSIDVSRVRSVIAQLAEGLAFLHARGVIHRDIKPSNVMVVDGTVKLLDFGLALESRRRDEDLAREARVVGTVGYLAPEYLERLVVSSAMDVYALGVLAFELVTGAVPFGGALGFLMRASKRPPVPRPSTINAEIPPDIDALIVRMLEGDPAARPTALEIASALSGALSSRHAVRRAQAFIGRADELAQIASEIADPGPHGRLLLVTGPSGVGKTTLIEEACRRTDVPTWRGRCHERERVPYRAFDSIIDDIATGLGSDPTLVTTVEHAGALARVFPVLAPLIEHALGVSAPQPAGDLRVERERALVGMTQLFGALAKRGAVVIDDLQWADDDSLELLAFLVERVGHPLTVIASWTTDEPPRRMRALLDRLGRSAHVLDLRGMAEGELAELIAELAPDMPAVRILDEARRSAGNPYFAELIGRELAITGSATLGGDPESRRLEQLPPGERMVAELAALATGATSFHELRDLAELSAQRLSSLLRGLEDARFLRATPSATGDPVYAFYHHRLRDAAYRAMPDAVRRTRHARFASWYERGNVETASTTSGNAEQLAYHWEHAGEPGRASRWAIAAGDVAFAQLSWAVAADWYQRAQHLDDLVVDRTPHDHTDQLIRVKVAVDERPLRAKLGDALLFGGKLAAAAAQYLALSNEVGDRDHWRVRAAEAFLKLGEIERGLGVLDDVLERRGERRAKSRAWSVGRALAVGARWLAPLPRRRTHNDAVLAAAYRVIASYLSTPHPIEAFEYVLRGVALADRSGDAAAHSQGLAMLGAYLAAGTLGRFGDRVLARAEHLARSSGDAYPRMVIAGSQGILRTLRGDWSGMRAAHATGEQICTQLGLERSWEASFLRSYWALGELYAGDHVRAITLLDELTSTSTGTDDLFTRALLGSYRGRALVVANDLSGARAVARQLDRNSHTQLGVAAIYRQVFAAELACAEHDWERASAITDALLESTRAQWLSTMPAISAMIEVPSAIADLGRSRAGEPRAARALATARRIHRRGRFSFYAVTALRLQAQAEQLLGKGDWRATLRRAAAAGPAGAVDRLAIAALSGMPIEPGSLGPAVCWSTAGSIPVVSTP